MRPSASVRFSREFGVRDADVVGARRRRRPCPARTHTPASWSSRSASSAPLRPVPPIDGEGVERADRGRAADARDGVEAGHDEVAPSLELDDHRVHVVLRAGQGRHRPDLGERRRARDGVDDQLGVGRDERLGHDRVAQPPAGHGEGLGEAVEDDRPLGHARQGRDRDVLLAVVQDAPVDLVARRPTGRAPRPARRCGSGPSRVSTPPVGLAGELMNRTRVRGRDQRGQLVDIEAELVAPSGSGWAPAVAPTKRVSDS